MPVTSDLAPTAWLACLGNLSWTIHVRRGRDGVQAEKEEAIVPAFDVGHYELIREVRPSAELCGGAELDLCMTKIAKCVSGKDIPHA